MTNLLKFTLMFFIILGCVPEKGGETASCGDNEAFNPATRKCYSLVDQPTVPTPLTDTIPALVENIGQQEFDLLYTDLNGDLALSCTIITSSVDIDGDGGIPVTCSCDEFGACKVKIAPDTNFVGYAEFTYTLTDVDGQSAEKIVLVSVTALNEAPKNSSTIPVSGSTINEDTEGTFTLNYTDKENDLATSCEISSLSSNINIIAPPAPFTDDCWCDNGVCKITFKGNPDFNGNGEFFF